MSKQTINIGASPNDGTGTPLRTSFDNTNQNFTELYTALGGGVGLPGATTQVIFNDGGTNLAGDAGLVYNKTTDTLTAGNAAITGAATVGTTLGVTGVSTLTGNVGIGVAPNLGLNVLKPSDTAFTNLPINVNFADSTAMAAGVGGGIAFSGRYDGTSSVSTFGVISGVKENGTAANYAGALVFGTRDAGGNVNIERLRINSTGNIVMKNANTGIDFSINSEAAGMTSELLNDYEEGTWSPTPSGGGNLTSQVSVSARYTKVGRLVTLSGHVTATVTLPNIDTYFVLPTLPFANGTVTTGSVMENASYKVGVSQVSASNLYGFFPAASAITAGAKDFYYSITYSV